MAIQLPNKPTQQAQPSLTGASSPIDWTTSSEEDDPLASPTLGMKLKGGLRAVRAKGPPAPQRTPNAPVTEEMT